MTTKSSIIGNKICYSFDDTMKKFSLITPEASDNDENNNNILIERMQTISIRKNCNLNANRRKSVYHANCNYGEKRESTNWNYDELNELKMKFLSLLSSPQSQMERSKTEVSFYML
jgi:hypothetical protein